VPEAARVCTEALVGLTAVRTKAVAFADIGVTRMGVVDARAGNAETAYAAVVHTPSEASMFATAKQGKNVVVGNSATTSYR